MNEQTLIPGCETAILAGLDPGMSGAIVMNDSAGVVSYFKMPVADAGVDLLAVRDLLMGVDMVIMEHPPLGGFQGHTRLTENSCFNQFKELYGLLTGAGIPFYTIRPKSWQRYLLFSKPENEKDWKALLHRQACLWYPTLKLPKYAADAALLHRMLTMIWTLPKEEWPG